MFKKLAMFIGAAKNTTESAQASAAIKKELSKKFPKTKFSVTKRAGGNAITVSWTNGPRIRTVKDIVDKYERGHFDGMQDLYVVSNRNKDLPQVNYVFTTRDMSPELEKFMFNEIKKTHDFRHLQDWEIDSEIRRIARQDFESHDFKE